MKGYMKQALVLENPKSSIYSYLITLTITDSAPVNLINVENKEVNSFCTTINSNYYTQVKEAPGLPKRIRPLFSDGVTRGWSVERLHIVTRISSSFI